MIEQYTSPAVVNNSQEPWLVGEGVSLSGSIAIPSLDFNFVTNAFPGTVTFSRASTATFFDSAGVLQSAAIDVPRLDYDPATLLPRGFLVEEQRTNLLTYSEAFDNAAWAKANSTITANAVVAPDGTTTADALIEDVNTSSHRVRNDTALTVSANTTYTLTVFAKLGVGSTRYLGLNMAATTSITTGSRRSVVYDLSDGTTTTTGGANWTLVAYDAVSVGNGWYRCRITVTTDASGTSMYVSIGLAETFSAASFANGYEGDGASGVYIWGAQLEAGAFSTSYIPTTTTALTRSADVAAVNTLSPWFNATEGALYAEGTAVDSISGTTPRIYAELGISAGTERIIVEARSSTSTRARTVTGGTTVISSVTYDALGVNTKVAAAYGSDGITAAVAGLAPVTTASGIPVVDTLFIGRSPSAVAAAQLNGHLRRITYYPRRLSNAELQATTA